MKLYFDITNSKCIGTTPSNSNMCYGVKVEDDFTLSKTVLEQDGEKDKEVDGKPIYNRPVALVTVSEVKTGEVATEEVTDRLEFVTTQKVNELDEPLFYAQDGSETTESTYEIHIAYTPTGNTQKVYDAEGNVVEEIPTYYKPVGFDFIEVTESENVIIQDAQPIMVTNHTGLYIKDIYETVTSVVERLEETEESSMVIKWINEEVPNMVMVEEEVYSLDGDGNNLLDENQNLIKVKTGNMIEIQNGVKYNRVESERLNFDRAKEPNMISVSVNISEKPEVFTVEDVINLKYQGVLEKSLKDYIIADMFLNENDIDFTNPDHSANTGISLLQLLPNGQAKTKPINLSVPSQSFEILECEAAEGVDIYLAGKKFVDGKLELSSPISNCDIKFINNTNKPIDIKSYAIGY